MGNFPATFMFFNEYRHFYTIIGKFPDDFISSARICCFHLVYILHFQGTSWKFEKNREYQST